MSAVLELTDALIKAGMSPAAAATLVARAGVEMAPSGDGRSPGAKRTAAWRERHKTSQNVTDETRKQGMEQASQTVTDRHKTSQRYSASLSSLPFDPKKQSEKKEKREANRGCRLPENWEPPESDFEATIIAIGQPRAEDELAKFRDHWKAQPGSKGVKSDWPAMWRNWTRRAVEYGGNRNGDGTGPNRTNSASGQSGSEAIMAGVAAAAERRARERGGTVRPMPPAAEPARRTDPELFGARDG